METNYPNLLSPYRVGQVLFKNRMLAGPLGFCVPNSGGCIMSTIWSFTRFRQPAAPLV